MSRGTYPAKGQHFRGSLGIDLHHACVVGDNAARLEECLRAALQRSDLVITTGGLGPTNDDLTKETVARVLGLPLEEDADSLRRRRKSHL